MGEGWHGAGAAPPAARGTGRMHEAIVVRLWADSPTRPSFDGICLRKGSSWGERHGHRGSSQCGSKFLLQDRLWSREAAVTRWAERQSSEFGVKGLNVWGHLYPGE